MRPIRSARQIHMVAVFQLLTNLLRITMQESAHEAGRKVNEMSIEGTRCVLTSSHESFRPVAGRPRLHRRLHLELIANCAEHVLDIRPFRQEPRARKRKPKNYQLLTAHRNLFKEVAHREFAYRKSKPKAA